MTEQQNAAINFLKKEGPKSSMEIGVELWFGANGKAWCQSNPQRYCRPAGKLMASLKRLGVVTQYWCNTRQRFLWRLK